MKKNPPALYFSNCFEARKIDRRGHFTIGIMGGAQKIACHSRDFFCVLRGRKFGPQGLHATSYMMTIYYNCILFSFNLMAIVCVIANLFLN